MTNASLVVVGTGIKLISHLTIEAKAYIEQADKVLYLVNEPLIKEWLHTLNKNAESLDEIYLKFDSRLEAYSAISEYILIELRKKQHVCVVIYGHPTVFAKPALDAVVQAKEENYDAKVLPGISSEDCLFADLLINPGSNGCLSLEATDLLIYRRQIDVSCHVILWQVSVIGMLNHSKNHDNNKGLKLLHQYLSEYYNSDHMLISYSAAQYPSFDPVIQKFTLHDLPHVNFNRTTTLYIPPAKILACNQDMLNKLGISVDNKIAVTSI